MVDAPIPTTSSDIHGRRLHLWWSAYYRRPTIGVGAYHGHLSLLWGVYYRIPYIFKKSIFSVVDDNVTYRRR